MKLTIGILIILGLLAAFCVMLLVSALRTDKDIRSAKGDVDVVVITRALPAMSVVNSRFIETQKVPKNSLPVGYLTEPIQAIGKVLSKSVVSGEVLTKSSFISEGTGAQLMASIPHGMRAVTVPVSNQSVERSLLYPGCVVDVIVSFKLRGRIEKGQALSTTLLRSVQVLAVEDETIVSKADVEEKTGRTIRRSSNRLTVTLLVDNKQAEALQLAMQNGVLSLAMRNPLDKRPVDVDPTVLSEGQLAKLGSLLSSSVPTSQLNDDWLETFYDMNNIDMNDPNVLISSIVKKSGEAETTRLRTIFSKPPQWEVTVIRGSDIKEEVLEAIGSGEE